MSIEFSGGMADDERIISTRQLSEDETENSLRPKTMADYIGQTKAKENLSVYIEAAKMRGESLDHTLLYGPPGLGKTTLAGIIAAEMGVNIRVTSGPAIEKAGDLAALLTNLSENDILFIDEIHRLDRAVEEILYPAMEDFAAAGGDPDSMALTAGGPEYGLELAAPAGTGRRASWLCPKSRRSDHLHQTGKTIGFFHLHGFRPHLVADDRILDKPDVAVKLSDTGAVLAHIFNGNCKFLIFFHFPYSVVFLMLVSKSLL